MSGKLKHCPFCSGQAERKFINDELGGGEYIRCTRCNAATALHYDHEREKLASRWNDRADYEVFDLIAHLHRQREFSLRTFGPGPRTQGVLDHIRKELAEIEANPTDVEEWADLLLLALDGAWRVGHEPEAITAAIEAKQTKNEGRTWPDWRTADPDKAIEYVRGED